MGHVRLGCHHSGPPTEASVSGQLLTGAENPQRSPPVSDSPTGTTGAGCGPVNTRLTDSSEQNSVSARIPPRTQTRLSPFSGSWRPRPQNDEWTRELVSPILFHSHRVVCPLTELFWEASHRSESPGGRAVGSELRAGTFGPLCHGLISHWPFMTAGARGCL